MADRVGQQIDNYRLSRLLGRGGFADVYLGEHVRRHTLVAVKVLHERLANDNVKDFLNEARSFRLTHPHIIRLLDFGLADDVPFLVMDYAPNGSLRQRHPKGTQVPLTTIVSYVKQIADALQYAHDEGLVHRDIKPDNMLLGQHDEVLLSDFGIASIAHSTQSLSMQDAVGTMAYIAPEQLRGKPRPASDQYSLGIVVYEWICGDRPFRGTSVEIQGQHLSVPPPSLCERMPTLKPEVEEVVMKALAKDTGQRFANVLAFATAFEQACQYGQPLLYTSTTDTKVPASPPSSVIPTLPIPIEPASFATLTSPPPLTNGNNSSQPIPLQADELAQQANPTDINNEPGTITAPKISNQATANLPQAARIPVPRPDTQPINPPTKQGIGGKMASGTGEVRGIASTGSRPLWRRGRWFITAVLLICTLLLIGWGAVFAAPGMFHPRANIIPGGLPSVTVTITPSSKDLYNTYIISAVTGTPDPTQRQVQARQLSSTSPSQSKTVPATDKVVTPAVPAKGTLTFYNGSGTEYSVAANTVLTDARGVEVENDVVAVIPAASPATGYGQVTVSAHAVNGGSSGNIPAFDFNYMNCCGSSGIFVSNTAPFTGGADPQNTAVKQSDIDGAANPLKKPLTDTAQANLQKQIRPGERLLDSPQCSTKVTSDPAVGDKATNVTVTVTVTCTAEVYDEQGALTMAKNLLIEKAKTDPGTAYTLVGDIVTRVTKIMVTDPKQATLNLYVNAEGIWVYQFNDARKQELAKQIASKSKQAAIDFLKTQPGIAKVDDIQLPSGDILPTDPQQITIVVQNVPGLKGTPPGGSATPPIMSQGTPTPTPLNGIGGS